MFSISTILLQTFCKKNLSWETTNEINTNNYEVEKSFDGNYWVNIGSVNAKNIAGNNGKLILY